MIELSIALFVIFSVFVIWFLIITVSLRKQIRELTRKVSQLTKEAEGIRLTPSTVKTRLDDLEGRLRFIGDALGDTKTTGEFSENQMVNNLIMAASPIGLDALREVLPKFYERELKDSNSPIHKASIEAWIKLCQERIEDIVSDEDMTDDLLREHLPQILEGILNNPNNPHRPQLITVLEDRVIESL